MLLEKYAKKVLKYMIKVDKPQDSFTIACNVKEIKDKDKQLELAEQSIDYLLEESYIKPDVTELNTVSYKLTNKGKTYFKEIIYNNIRMVLNGIVFPSIVAFITSLITTLVTLLISN